MSKSFPVRGEGGRRGLVPALPSHPTRAKMRYRRARPGAIRRTNTARPELDPQTMSADSTPSLFATGRTIRRLRAEIEAATGLAFGSARPGAIAVIWARSRLPGRLLTLAGCRRLTVATGPLLSPYDSPDTGFASLRISLDGAPVGGEGGIRHLRNLSFRQDRLTLP